MPFEINRITIEPDGFKVTFTKPVDQATGSSTDSYVISAFTHPYHGGYGGPEIEQHQAGRESGLTCRRRTLRQDSLSKSSTRDSCTNSIWHVCVLATTKNCCIATRSTPSMRFHLDN